MPLLFQPIRFAKVRFVKVLVALCVAISLLWLAGCDKGDLETRQTGSFVDLRNNSTGKVELDVEKLGRTEDGQDTELVLTYTLTGIDPASLPPGSSLLITLVDSDGQPIVVTESIPLDPENATGEIEMVAPGQTGEVAAVATLEVASDDGEELIETEEAQGILEIDLSNPIQPSELLSIEDFSLELVENSYESELQGDRRIHRFTVRAYDQDCISIRGLSEDVGEYFSLYENSFLDVESPVDYDSRSNFIRVYVVLDASSSITDNDRQQLMNAARYASDRMLDDYVVDFRQFSGDIQRLASYRDYAPDTGESATAFYYAIDTVLEEIEEHGPTDDYHVIIGFTDGVDLASRNHYDPSLSKPAIQAMIRDKVEQFRLAPGFDYGSGLELHLLSVGNVTEERPALDSLAAAGGGQHVFASDKSALEPMLETLVNRVLATYHLQYSSQQQADDSDLRLDVSINEIIKPLQIRHAGGLQPASTSHFCQVR